MGEGSLVAAAQQSGGGLSAVISQWATHYGPCSNPPPPPPPHPRPQLTAEEKAFLSTSTDVRRQFEAADKAIGEAAVLSLAAKATAGAGGR